jgi:hypothetical protein
VGRKIDAAPGRARFGKFRVERLRLVAEQLGRAQLKDERQLRTVTNIRELEWRAVAAGRHAHGAGSSEALPP